jgi:hypothetical protein
MNWNHESIKEKAESTECTVPDLIVLDKENDPFYIGTPSHWMWARWFADIWDQHGKWGDHLRRLHYRIEHKGLDLPRPIRCDGEVFTTYKNHKGCWQQLLKASKFARYLGLVDPDSFVDRRNPEPKIFTTWNDEDFEPGYFVSDNDWELPSLPDLPHRLPEFDGFIATGYEGIDQDYLVEVWCEKTTMNDVLVPICEKYGVNLVTASGHPTITATREFLKRVRKPARILYISDHDHAGKSMPLAVARKIEFYHKEFSELDIKLEPIALTAEQVDEFDLPREPSAKMEKTELDALEALYPGELAKIVTEEIERYIDINLERKSIREKVKFQDHLDNVFLETRANYEQESSELGRVYTAFLEDYKQAIEPLRERMTEILDQYGELNDSVRDDLENIDINPSEFPLPDPDIDGDPDGLLYESSRDYLDQLESYKKNG